MTSDVLRNLLDSACGVGHPPARNQGVPLDLDWIEGVRVDTHEVERRADALPERRPVESLGLAAGCLRAVTCLDLTTLAGDETPEQIQRLCARARQPVRPDVLEALGIGDLPLRVASVCLYPKFAPIAAEALAGSGIPVCTVAGDFPSAQAPLARRLEEVRAARAAGAAEIDFVITRTHALRGAWAELYEEVRAFREACGPTHMKVILATGDLASLLNVARASRVAMMAGADFIKTSTGKERTNATLPVGLVMAGAIREYRERTAFDVGLKPAGGIGQAEQALDWLTLAEGELGPAWTGPQRFRFGASSLLGDLERHLEAGGA